MQPLPMICRYFALALVLAMPSTWAVGGGTPEYRADPAWPHLPLPNDWAIGEIGGLEVDAGDNVWIIHRPGTLAPWEQAAALDPPRAECCVSAPPVIQFDTGGHVVRAWGGPGESYDWPRVEHGIAIDHRGNVWVGGSGARPGPNGEPADGMVLKFTADGEFLMQIGEPGPSKGSRDPGQLSGPADMAVHPPTNEVFIADGYGNHRVIVFDADTGAFKRMWGAYGEPPTDEALGPYDPSAPPARQFRTAHCLTLADDGTVFVCDRDNNRVQVFSPDGQFLREHYYATATMPPGTVGHLSLWTGEGRQWMAISDLGNVRLRLADAATGQELASFGHPGFFGGQLARVHQADFDSHGNIYTGEAAGRRVQRWIRR